MDKKLFLDLEETLIESWNNPTLLPEKVSVIREFCKEHSITEATMFSLAIFDEREVEFFNKHFKEWLEKHLEISLQALALEVVFKEIISKNGILANMNELSDIFIFNMKEQAFTEWIFKKEDKNVEFILFDDMIQNKDIFIRDKNVKITLNKI